MTAPEYRSAASHIPFASRWARGLVVACVLALGVAPARADEGSDEGAGASPPRAEVDLGYHLGADLAIVGASLGLVAAINLFELGPDQCRWCERSDLNRVDRWFRDRAKGLDGPAMEAVGGITTLLVPITAIGLDALAARREGRDYGVVAVDSLIIVESMSVAMALTSIVKISAGRQRPYTLDWPESEVGGDPEQNASFFSGHTSFAFSLAVSAGTVASMRRYRLAPWIWATGLTLASVCSFARMGQDQHYFTDLVVGAAVGAAAGVAVPRLLHAPRSVSLGVLAVEGASGLLVQGRF